VLSESISGALATCRAKDHLHVLAQLNRMRYLGNMLNRLGGEWCRGIMGVAAMKVQWFAVLSCESPVSWRRHLTMALRKFGPSESAMGVTALCGGKTGGAVEALVGLISCLCLPAVAGKTRASH
jgi:hypothetical protein